MKQTLLIALLLINVQFAQAQTITGTLKQHAGQQITLTGFNYYKSYALTKTTLDSSGNFTLNYPEGYKGMAILKTQDNSSLVFVLTEPNIQLTGTHLQETDNLVFTNSTANKNFIKYAKDQGVRGNVLSALDFLKPLYQNQALLLAQENVLKTIENEQARLKKEDTNFITNLSKSSYVRWFIPFRKMVQEMPSIVRTKTHQIPNAIAVFRKTDFNHPNFKNSGLFKEFIEGHYMLLENMGQSLDSIAVQMNASTEHLVENLSHNEVLLNTVGEQLFNYLEKRSLFKASEYLSLKLLSNNQCTINTDLAKKLEGYRAMKVGATAPDIIFKNQDKSALSTDRLSAIKTTKLVVFGASWCPNCKTEVVELLKQYDNWTAKNIAIVYISIDTDKAAFKTAYANAPWQTHCDFKGWETQAAKDYYVSGTPSYFLLDADNKILVRPKTVAHANAWLNQFVK